LRALFPPNGMAPDDIPDAKLCDLVNDKLKEIKADRKHVSVPSVAKARKQLLK
jgi:hypothetical protein